MKNYIALILLTLGYPLFLEAQDLRGGEFRFIHVDNGLTYDLEVVLYFNVLNEPGLEEITIFADDDLYQGELVEVISLNRGISAYRYTTQIYLLNTLGTYVIYVLPALTITANNLPHVPTFALNCDFSAGVYTRPPFDSTMALWELFDFDYQLDAEGHLRLSMQGYDPDGDGTVYYGASSWLQYFENLDLYNHPAPAENLVIDMETGEFVWYNPPGPGRYLLGFELWSVTNDDSQSINNRFTRYLVIELTEEDFMMSTNTNDLLPAKVIIYPNPTTTTTTLEYGGLNGEIYLKAINTQGQVMLQKTLASTAQIQREVIDVSTWPAGIYWIELRNEQGQVTKKLVVE